MKKLLFSTLLLSLFLFVAGCEKNTPLAPTDKATIATTGSGAEQIALDLIAASQWPLEETVTMPDGSEKTLAKPRLRRLPRFERLPITGDIFHYRFYVPVGSGPYEVIGIHRVVREKRPYLPIRTAKTIFLQHGDAKDFEGMFLPGTRSSHNPDDFGIAVFLAEHDVDVWGIDQAWTLVPENVTDFSFMKEWGLQKQVDDLVLALSVARMVRLFTGAGCDKMILSGYSSGVMTGYAFLNQETQLPKSRRQVQGYIPVDVPFKTDSQVMQQIFTTEYHRVKDLIDQGQYGDWIPFATIGNLARTDPDGASPLIPGFTNLQAGMFFAAGPIFGPVDFHYFAGVWENDLPVDLQYVTKDQYFDFMEASVPWEAARFIMEYSVLIGNVEDSPFDDHLGQITVPILNVSPAGGFGEFSKYTTTLVGSTDITHLMPSLHPADQALLDIGHIDIFIAPIAQSLVWQPILSWIEAHTSSALLSEGQSDLNDLE